MSWFFSSSFFFSLFFVLFDLGFDGFESHLNDIDTHFMALTRALIIKPHLSSTKELHQLLFGTPDQKKH